MKILGLLFALFILASCSSSRIDRKIDDVSWDSLADESYLRWGEKRLEQFASQDQDVVNCYKGEARETLEQYKRDYMTKGQTPYYCLIS